MNDIKIKSPAKINIGLNVVSKREDGFHNIETVFYPVSLADQITISEAETFYFTSNDKLLEAEPNNLIVRAKNVLENRCNIKANLHIDLQKNIPIGAGLGGGSSNAAAILKALNNFYCLNLSETELESIGLELGSDVPFFIKEEPVFAESRGEVFTPINLKINLPILIVNPGIHISTRLAYENIIPKKSDFELKSLSGNNLDIENWKDKVTNAFEEYAFNSYPEIKEVKEKLYESGAVFALLSGSGSSVFAIFKNKLSAIEAESYFSKKYFTYLSENE
jgi:4-diphosphocytidyl-2-C-methyl-D-erythritol kinase